MIRFRSVKDKNHDEKCGNIKPYLKIGGTDRVDSVRMMYYTLHFDLCRVFSVRNGVSEAIALVISCAFLQSFFLHQNRWWEGLIGMHFGTTILCNQLLRIIIPLYFTRLTWPGLIFGYFWRLSASSDQQAPASHGRCDHEGPCRGVYRCQRLELLWWWRICSLAWGEFHWKCGLDWVMSFNMFQIVSTSLSLVGPGELQKLPCSMLFPDWTLS